MVAHHRLTDEDLTQIRSYASAITNDERFSQPNSSWEFWLVGNTTREDIDEAREQDNLPFGVAYNGKKYKVIVKKWAEVIGDAEHRLKFVQDSLQYESGRHLGLAHMRDKYAEYLPTEVIDEVARASDDAPVGTRNPTPCRTQQIRRSRRSWQRIHHSLRAQANLPQQRTPGTTTMCLGMVLKPRRPKMKTLGKSE